MSETEEIERIVLIMSRRAATWFAVAVLLATVVTRQNAVSQASLQTGRTPQITESLGLSARLTNAIVRTDNSIELDFILLNTSSVPIRLAQRWNSWGAYQWQFRVVDAKGTAYELKNPQQAWDRNALTMFTIRPSEEQITRCRLDMTTTSHALDETAIFALPPFEGAAFPGALQSPRTNGWVFPATVTGIFSASKQKQTGVNGEAIETTWEGTIATKPLVVVK